MHLTVLLFLCCVSVVFAETWNWGCSNPSNLAPADFESADVSLNGYAFDISVDNWRGNFAANGPFASSTVGREGDKFAFMQGLATLRTCFDLSSGADYNWKISFKYAGRDPAGGEQQFKLSVFPKDGGAAIYVSETISTHDRSAWQWRDLYVPIMMQGNYIFKFETLLGSDNTAMVDKIIISRGNPIVGAKCIPRQDTTFDSVDVHQNGFVQAQWGENWASQLVQGGASGFAANGPFGVSTVGLSGEFALIQSMANISSCFSFDGNDVGTWAISFRYAGRNIAGHGDQTFNLYISRGAEVLVGTVNTQSNSDWATAIFSFAIPAPGNYLFTFVGLSSGDNTGYIDSVELDFVPAPAPGGVKGDPLVIGFHGERFWFHGHAEQIFNIYNDEYVNVNSIFGKATEQRGTVMRVLAVEVGGHQIVFGVQDAHSATSITFTLDGKEAVASSHRPLYLSGCLEIGVRKGQLVIRTPLSEINFVIRNPWETRHADEGHIDRDYLDFVITPPEKEIDLLIGGVIGQTASGKKETEESLFIVDDLFSREKSQFYKATPYKC